MACLNSFDASVSQAGTSGKTYVSSNFIRNRGQQIYFADGFDDVFTNNSPPIKCPTNSFGFVERSETGEKDVQIVQVTLSPNGQFVINGLLTPLLKVQRGKQYKFHIHTPGFRFFFSSKPNGSSDIFDDRPTDNGIIAYTMPVMPMSFYYTSFSNCNSIGGKVEVY